MAALWRFLAHRPRKGCHLRFQVKQAEAAKASQAAFFEAENEVS
jgi:hypothetical protein